MTSRLQTFRFQLILFVLISIIFGLGSCGDSYIPKPAGYLRIDLPEHTYQTFDTTFPFSFEYSTLAQLNRDGLPDQRPYWLNMDYPKQKARIYISYRKVENDLIDLLEDSRSFTMKQIPKADFIRDSIIMDSKSRVFGMEYLVSGKEAASPYQFFVTDSSSHFLRGALYFNHAPNNDSLEPVIDYIKNDLRHLLNTLEWK